MCVANTATRVLEGRHLDLINCGFVFLKEVNDLVFRRVVRDPRDKKLFRCPRSWLNLLWSLFLGNLGSFLHRLGLFLSIRLCLGSGALLFLGLFVVFLLGLLLKRFVFVLHHSSLYKNFSI